jgi:hypothetical protein
MDYWNYYCCVQQTECSCTGATGATGATGESGATGVGIENVIINNSTEMLELYMTDGTVIQTGPVVGPAGATGPGYTNAEINSSGNLELTTTTGEVIDCGSVTPEPKIVTSNNNAIYQIPQGYNTFVNSENDYAIRITLPTSGNYIGEIFTVSNKLMTAGDSEQSAYVMTTNTSMDSDFPLTNAVGGAAFLWNGHFWQLITQN